MVVGGSLVSSGAPGGQVTSTFSSAQLFSRPEKRVSQPAGRSSFLAMPSITLGQAVGLPSPPALPQVSL